MGNGIYAFISARVHALDPKRNHQLAQSGKDCVFVKTDFS